jgi:hypothetical protein
MSQTIRRPGFGTIKIVKSWVKADGVHIGQLEGGGYAHLSGLPVQALDELDGLMMTDDEWQVAVAWFDGEKERAAMAPRNIVIKPDGSFEWSDGTKVTNYNEVIQAIPAGKLQDAALDWLADQRAAAIQREKVKDSPLGSAAAKVAGTKPRQARPTEKPSSQRKAPPRRVAPKPAAPSAKAETSP